jgi:O-antigen/teichoic acid export membrane protein
VLYLALASIPFHLLFNVFQAVARAVDRFDLANLANLARAGGLLCAAVGVLIVAGGGLEQALVAILIVHGLATVILGIVVARETGVQWRVDREEIVESARFGSRSYAHYMTGELHERLDLFMIAYLLADPAQAGLYAIAVRLIGALKLVPDALAASLFTVAAGMSEREAGRLTSFVSRHSLLWTVAAVVALAAVAPLAVRLLFGEQYSGAIPPLQVLLLAMAMLTVARVLSRYFVAVGRQRANIVTQILAVLLNLTLNLLWIPRYGIIGAAWASLASYGLQALLIVVWFGRDSGRGIRDALLVQRGDFAEYRQRLTPLLERLRSS